jgi:beta-carotene hydroxylase
VCAARAHESWHIEREGGTQHRLMGLKNQADWRTLLWAALGPSLVAVQFWQPSLVPYLWWVSCYFALSFGIIAHNHNHCPTFKDRRHNELFGSWLSIFYGYPTFAWIPTHNLNHHKYVNTDGDATITWRFTNSHNLLVAVSYFFVSSYYQSGPIKTFISKARTSNPGLHRRIMRQYAIWLGGNLVLWLAAIALHGFGTGSFVFIACVAFPEFFALWTIMLFNYDQHVHTDPWSQNHSRSFVNPLLNFLLFNNGLHAAHHERPGEHWSNLAAVHAEIAPRIDPSLLQTSLWLYWFRQYLLAPFFPSLGTKQLGPGPMNPPDGRRRTGNTADVELGEAGSNAASAVRLTA